MKNHGPYLLAALLVFAGACGENGKDEDEGEKKKGTASGSETPAPSEEKTYKEKLAALPLERQAAIQQEIAVTAAPALCNERPSLLLTGSQEDLRIASDRALLSAALSGKTPDGFTIRIGEGFRNGGGADVTHFDLVQELDGTPLCGGALRAFVMGGQVTLPSFPEPRAPSVLAFGEASAALAAAARSIGALPESAVERRASACFHTVLGELVPAHQILASIGGLPYRTIAGPGGVYLVESQAAHAAGTAQTFKRNPTEASLVSTPLTLSDGVGGHLEGGNVRVVDYFGARTGAVAADGNFAPAQGTPEFGDVAIFAHAQEMLGWFLQNTTMPAAECAPIEIEAHAEVEFKGQVTKNNAVYLPSWNQRTGHPRIQVGDGDGKMLQNLALDFDAVAHELGHHFVYRRLKSLSYNPSLVIHEGFADFFVFAATGDTCLGESLCPESSGFCIVPAQCLRTAETKLTGIKFHNDLYEKLSYHQKSQALSGMLIEMGRDKDIGLEAVIKIAFSAIDFLKEKSELEDMLTALLQGDQAAFGGAHACKLLETAKGYGLVEEAKGIDCNTYVTAQAPALR